MTSGARPGRLRHAEPVMGTVVSFDVPAWAGPALRDAVRWLHWVDATFSPYRDDSDVSRFGRGSLTLADCVPELAEVLAACAGVGARSGGYFTTEPGGRFDPSGYVKGWAIERAAAMLTAAGSAEHSVNGGGDIQCVGDHGPGQPWRVGIADPQRPGSLALVVAGRDFAVATSGVAERGPHIINPHTGQPASGLASITVVGARLAAADAYATAAFAMGPGARDWVASLDGYEAFAITPGGATWQTSGFRAYLPRNPRSIRPFCPGGGGYYRSRGRGDHHDPRRRPRALPRDRGERGEQRALPLRAQPGPPGPVQAFLTLPGQHVVEELVPRAVP